MAWNKLDYDAAFVYKVHRSKEFMDILVVYVAMRVGVGSKVQYEGRFIELFPEETSLPTRNDFLSKVYQAVDKTLRRQGGLETWPRRNRGRRPL